MAEHSSIEWTDATWNVIVGCSRVSKGCENCYAERLAGGRLKHTESRKGLTRETSHGPVWTGETRLVEKWLDQPLRWSRPRRIFVCAHGDLFHDSVSNEQIAVVFAVMAAAPRHTFQVLTKRPERAVQWFHWFKWLPEDDDASAGVFSPRLMNVDWPLPNVWIGTSIEDQKTADERIPYLLEIPAAVRFLSAEPLLGPIDLRDWFDAGHETGGPAGWVGDPIGIQWIIVGGESGPNARPMKSEWARQIRDDCEEANVPFFFKQWGAYGEDGVKRSKKANGRLLNGVTHDGMPGEET